LLDDIFLSDDIFALNRT